MSLSFNDAIQARLVAGLDPMTPVIRQFAEDQAKVGKVEAAREILKLTDELESRITNGLANGLDSQVIAGWQRMLKSFTS
jgi:hypothetical protein